MAVQTSGGMLSLSTAEAEYYSASEAGVDVTYLRRLTEDMGFEQKEPAVLLEDNMACVFIQGVQVKGAVRGGKDGRT